MIFSAVIMKSCNPLKLLLQNDVEYKARNKENKVENDEQGARRQKIYIQQTRYFSPVLENPLRS